MKAVALVLFLPGLIPISGAFSLAEASAAQTPLRLSAQQVVELVLEQGLEAKAITLEAEKAGLPLARARGTFDWSVIGSGSYELTRLQSISGLSNLEDRNTFWKAGISKKLPTGTTFTLSYNRTYQNSIMSSFLSSAHFPDQSLDYFDLGIRQEILGNLLGIQDRGKILIAERDLTRSNLKRREDLEALVLDALRAYWKAYVSKAALSEALLAREKYSKLVAVLQRKVSAGLADPSDLGKVKTEFAAQDRRVKSASLAYLSDLDRLFSSTRLPADRDVEFDASLDLPGPPDDRPDDREDEEKAEVESSRAVQRAKLGVENAELELKSVKLSLLPEVAVFGNLSANAVDRTAELSFSQATSLNHPRYLVGMEVKFRPWSDTARGEEAHRGVLHDEALNTLSRTREAQALELTQAKRSLRSTYIIARTAAEAVRQWEAVIQEREGKFKNGRIGTAEIIQDYSLYFQAKADHVAAVADYYYSSQRLRAARDQLIQ